MGAYSQMHRPAGQGMGAKLGRLGIRLLEAIDLLENLRKVTKMMKAVPNGWIAVVACIPLFISTVGGMALSFLVDLYPSWSALQPLKDGFAEIVIPWLEANKGVTPEQNRWLYVGIWLAGWSAVLVPFSLTMMFTAVELLGAKFSKYDVEVWQWAAWGGATWDLVTDIKVVNKYMLLAWPAFVGAAYADANFFGILFSMDLGVWFGAISYHILWLAALLASTYFVELATIISMWALIGFLWKGPIYLILNPLLGKGWKAKMDRTGGFSDSSVLGGSNPREPEVIFAEEFDDRPPRGGHGDGFVADDDGGLDDINLDELFGDGPPRRGPGPRPRPRRAV